MKYVAVRIDPGDLGLDWDELLAMALRKLDSPLTYTAWVDLPTDHKQQPMPWFPSCRFVAVDEDRSSTMCSD